MAHRPFSYVHVKQVKSSPEHSQQVIARESTSSLSVASATMDTFNTTASEIFVPPDMTGEADKHSDLISGSTETLRLTVRQHSTVHQTLQHCGGQQC